MRGSCRLLLAAAAVGAVAVLVALLVSVDMTIPEPNSDGNAGGGGSADGIDASAPLGSGGMFDAIAHRYDLTNRVMSLGADGSWRRELVDALRVGPGHRILDVATGTADVAILIARTVEDASVLGVDPSENMLSIGRAKAQRAAVADRVVLRTGDAQGLRELADDSFDGAAMAFGIRNVPDRAAALRE